MALRVLDIEAQERERIAPVAEELMRFVQCRDPHAVFSLEAGPDEGIWLLYAQVSRPLNDDPAFAQALAEREVVLHDEHGVSISTIPVARGRAE